MKPFVAKPRIVLMICLACLSGCNQKKGDLKDPLIRQQLTAMLANLNSHQAIPQAARELGAIFLVNESKLSEQQWQVLFEAMGTLEFLKDERYYLESQFTDPYSKAIQQEYVGRFLKAKKLIGEAAATF